MSSTLSLTIIMFVRIVLAADIGGTVLRAALVSEDGRVHARVALPSQPREGPAALVERLLVALGRVLEEAPPGARASVGAIVLAGPGPLSAASGELLDPIAPFDRRYDRLPLVHLVQERFALPCVLARDTVVAARGEASIGAARGSADFVYLTVSTGIGAAVVSGGRLIAGADGLAGELGHMPATEANVVCPCGALGHLEAIAGGYAIGRLATEMALAGRGDSLAQLVRQAPDHTLTAADVAAAANGGDPIAAAILGRAQRAIAAAVVGYVNAFNPTLLVVGGSIARAGGATYLAALENDVRLRAIPTAARRVSVVSASLGDDAGLAGAAAIARDCGYV